MKVRITITARSVKYLFLLIVLKLFMMPTLEESPPLPLFLFSALSGEGFFFLCQMNIEFATKMLMINIANAIRRSLSWYFPKIPANNAPKIPPRSPPLPKKPISLFASLGLKTSFISIQNCVCKATMKIFAHTQKARGIHEYSRTSEANNCCETRHVTLKTTRLEMTKMRLGILT
ncbi:hypothetical protein ES703_45620 [subsurface metagenome]